jgi:hypothetical protein
VDKRNLLIDVCHKMLVEEDRIIVEASQKIDELMKSQEEFEKDFL